MVDRYKDKIPKEDLKRFAKEVCSIDPKSVVTTNIPM